MQLHRQPKALYSFIAKCPNPPIPIIPTLCSFGNIKFNHWSKNSYTTA